MQTYIVVADHGLREGAGPRWSTLAPSRYREVVTVRAYPTLSTLQIVSLFLGRLQSVKLLHATIGSIQME